MIIDHSGRGVRTPVLGLFGVLIAALGALSVYLLGLRYTGSFTESVEVTARMTSTGDGVPQRADVTFRGVLVGQVAHTAIAARGESQEMLLRLEPALAQRIPSTVTARVVPNNIFGVTAVELIDQGPAARPLSSGATISQDTSTVSTQLQTTLTTLRTVLDAIDPLELAAVLGALADALDPSYRMPGSTIERLDAWTTQVRATPGIGALLGDLGAAASAVNESAPELIDTLSTSVTAARTLTEKRAALISLLTAAGGALDSTDELFARNPGAGPALVGGLNDTFGALAADPAAIAVSVANLNTALAKLATVFNWGPNKQMRWVVDISFTPFQQYTAADCPRYGPLTGPRCGGPTVPESGPAQRFPTPLLPGRIVGAGPLPTLPVLPGLPAPQAAPAAATDAQELHGVEAIAAVVGAPPNAAQLILLGPVLAGGALTVSSTPAAGGN
ncbi:MCE family protein [Nocardia sp. NPDC048505]|uniref:MlaD family protein n=1 Tax=unclassified Nocardia TaxID=2637762 RepID=UPI0033C0D9CD